MDDESKAKSEDDLAATRTEDYDSDQNRYFVEDGLLTTSFECSILSEFGWTTRTIQQQQQKQSILHHHHQRRSTDVDLTINNESESSSSVGGGLLFPSSSSNMVVEQAASTSNYTSVSSSSSDQDQLIEKSIGSDDQTPTPCVQIPSKKKGQRRIRQQRFAFVTKSEVDHLEDGYRWRKYGQKAVKNSPYPRGYYRCTNTKCTVKKRVERSCEDPSTVITTYEGQHCHQTAWFPRGSGLSIREAAFAVQMSHPNSQLYYPEVQHLPQRSPQGIINIAPTLQPTSVPDEPRDSNSMVIHTEPPPQPAGSTPQFPSEEGLLGDIVSPRLMRNNFLP